MTRGETTAKLCVLLLCAAWVSACNITDPTPPTDGGTVSQDGGGGNDAGGEDARDEPDARDEEDAGGCAAADRNACAGSGRVSRWPGGLCVCDADRM